MAKKIFSHNLNVILIYIDEAHSTAWPLSIDKLLNVPQREPQKNLEDRIKRAKEMINKYNSPYPVYVDNWDNNFAELFRAWPDKYHCINNKMQVIAKSEYYQDGDKEALIITDCTILLEKLINDF